MTGVVSIAELSLPVKELGIYYCAGVGFASSGDLPGLMSSSGTRERYSDAVASFRRHKFGWGAEARHAEATKDGSLLISVLIWAFLAATIFLLWYLMNKLQNPVANIVVGISFFVLAIKTRHNFQKRWTGSMLEYDCGSLAFTLLLFVIGM